MAPSVEDILVRQLESLDKKMDSVLEKVAKMDGIPERVSALESMKGQIVGAVALLTAILSAAFSGFLAWWTKK